MASSRGGLGPRQARGASGGRSGKGRRRARRSGLGVPHVASPAADVGADRTAAAAAAAPSLKSPLRAGARVQEDLNARGWRFCLIGGVANFRWETPRPANDLDLTVLTGFGYLSVDQCRSSDMAAKAPRRSILIIAHDFPTRECQRTGVRLRSPLAADRRS